jgi:hypothetical protein
MDDTKYFYKYIGLKSDSTIRADFLNNGLFRLTQPNQLNDPFEVNPRVLVESNAEEDRELARQTLLADGFAPDRVDRLINKPLKTLPVYPPLIPTVSSPIAHQNGNVLYVIHQDLSLEAPHFLTRRRGPYVRTAEFSQTFDAQLASWQELQFLANRRTRAIDQRCFLYERARTRCNRMLASSDSKNRAAICVSVGPSFPASRLIELSRLQETMEKVGVLASAGVSLQDSLVYAESGYRPHCIEGTVFGTYFSYRTLLPGDNKKLHFGSLLGSLMTPLRSGCRFLAASGFDGLLYVKMILSDMYGNSFCWDPYLDEIPCKDQDEIVVEDEIPLEFVRGNMGPFCVNLFKTMTFSAGYREAFKGNDDAIIKEGLKALNENESFLSL